MTCPSGISKWQVKSIRINQIRWELEKLLNENLSEEEKQSQKYSELIESLDATFKHVVPKENCFKIRGAWRMTLLISISSSGGAILLKILEFLVTLVTVSNNIPPGGVP